MKNVITCGSCNTENPGYNAICINCKAFLRERVVNIDLWSILWKIVETPVKAFQKIVFAEHKNFIFFLAVLLSIKYFIFSLMLAVPVFSRENPFDNIYTKYFLFTLALFIMIFILSYIFKYVFKALSVKTRLKDIISVLIYSNTPVIFALAIFFPVEMVLFGDYQFTFNPSPFILKPSAAYVLAFVEGLLIVWSVVLSMAALYSVSKSKIWSVILGLIFSSVMFICIIYTAKII